MPAFRAGGPIQSINNLTKFLVASGHKPYVLCSNTDLNNVVLEVPSNKWVDVGGVKVFYNNTKLSKKDTHKIIEDVAPDVIFINGLYSLMYTIYPLMYKGSRKILSARGMLHPGALSQKSFKKKLFLRAFKFFGLHKKCSFHATTEEEADYIKDEMGRNAHVWNVTNLPNLNDYTAPVLKEKGSVKLVSISLISPMKNILLVLEALNLCDAHVIYGIFGPVKDREYWDACKKEIQKLRSNVTVQYKGEVKPQEVLNALKEYHYFVLPSKSENFGHAIYEALSAGRPVLTSHKTPWNGLKAANAGYNLTPENKKEFVVVLNEMAEVDNDTYMKQSEDSRKYVLQQFDIEKVKLEYTKMFVTDSVV